MKKSNGLPLINHLWRVLDEHTIPIEEEPGSGYIEAGWLVDLVARVQNKYKQNGTLD
jgi:hypothetical protein